MSLGQSPSLSHCLPKLPTCCGCCTQRYCCCWCGVFNGGSSQLLPPAVPTLFQTPTLKMNSNGGAFLSPPKSLSGNFFCRLAEHLVLARSACSLISLCLILSLIKENLQTGAGMN